jgi:hypothetical protein
MLQDAAMAKLAASEAATFCAHQVCCFSRLRLFMTLFYDFVIS